MLRISERKDGHVFRHEAMATELTVQLCGVDAQYARQVSYELFWRIDDVERKLSLYREDSDVSRINLARAGEAVRVSEDCVACLEVAVAASVMTGNRFHAFLGAESLRRKGNVPGFLRQMVEAGISDEGPAVEVDASGRVVKKVSEGQLLDLGGVGKGYALDITREILEDWEVPACLLSFGGSTLLAVVEDEEMGWDGYVGEMQIPFFKEGALSSSGTGFQGEHVVGDVVSRWIRSYSRAKTAALADALSTAALLMTREELEALAEMDSSVAFGLEKDGGLYSVNGFLEGS